MSARPRRAASTTTFVAKFGPTGSLRQEIGKHGRVHVDRPLPFIALHRAPIDEGPSLARRVALTSPAYAVWPGPAEDAAAAAALAAVLNGQAKHFPHILIVSLYDLPRPEPAADDTPELPAFEARIGAAKDALSQAAAKALTDAMGKVEIDLRLCGIAKAPAPKMEPGIAKIVAGRGGYAHISLGLPRIDIAPGGREFYPQVFHDLAVATFDALLKAACAFMAKAELGAPHHYRMLGRSAFIDAARSVDTKLNHICRDFDFLLSVSPINTTQAYDQFEASKWRKPPDFQYRPLTVDPVEAKRALYRIDLKGVEDPTLETLFAEKRQEIDHQLTMLELRNSPRFRFASLMLYEPVDSALREAAREILAADSPRKEAGDGEADCHEVADAAQNMIDRYAARDPAFAVKVELRDDIAAGMMVSSDNLYISTATKMPRHRVEPLLHHEIGIHLLTFVNGAEQGLNIFKRGLAGYEGFQEGLGVFAEWAVGGLTRARLRLLAARVLAVDAMTDGVDFLEVFTLLRKEHGFSARTAFHVAARVFRSGGLAKDAIYLRGFKAVLDLLAAGQSLDPYWYGKIDARHVGVVEELAERGLLRKPALAPEFLSSEVVVARIAGLRKKLSFSSLLAGAA